MKRNALINAAALQLILVPAVLGQWTPVDNFSVLTPGDIKGQNGWGGDATIVANVAAGPVDPGNQTLAYTSTGPNGNVYKTALGIEDDGSTGTVFMRVYIAGNSDPDAPFGLAVSDTPDWGSTDLGGKFRADGANAAIKTNSDGLLASIQYGAWYKVWLVASNPVGTGSESMTFYLQRYGDATYGNQVSIGSVGPAIGTPGNGTIDTLAFHKYNANAPVYIDDIYYDDSGQNLSDPLDSVDTDGDGLADGWELDYFPSLSVAYGGTDGTLQSDGDGFTDAQEYAAGTNPLVADTDGDGLNDDVELVTYNCSPTNPDTDGDGLSDGDEVNLHSTLPDDHDSDDDGVGDGIEVAQGTSPTNPAEIPPSLVGTGLWSSEYKESVTNDAIGSLAAADALWGGLDERITGSAPYLGTYQYLNFSAGGNNTPDTFTNPDGNNFHFAGNVAMPVPTGEGFTMTDAAIKSTGYLLAEVAGTYTFNSVSDDGSRLTIDGKVVDSNDQPQGVGDRFVRVDLLKGFHTVEYFVFQGGGGFAQELSTYVIPEARSSLGDLRDWKLVPAADMVTDTDVNGLPDEWEAFYGLASGPGGDDDGDGLDNAGELAQLSDPTVVDTDGDGLDDAAESAFGSDPLLADSDGDGLTDPVEQAAGTNPNLADSDGDGYSDPQELAAGSSPIIATEVPDTYLQTFDSFSDGETSFLDGTSLTSNKGQASVQGGMLRLLEDGNGSCNFLFRLPPLAGSDQQWCVSFDYLMVDGPDGDSPADGFSMSYGPIANSNPGGETGFAVDDTVSFSTTTYAGAGNQGQRINEQVAGTFSTTAIAPGVIFNNNQTVRGRFTASFDSAGNLVDFSTTGMITDAAFNDIVTAITAATGDTWAIAGRTGGANQGLFIDTIAVTAGAGSTDSDADGLPDAWELTQGLDPTTDTDGATVDSDGDTLTNGQEFDYGSDPLAADGDADGANDAQEIDAGTDRFDADSDDDGLLDGAEINGAVTSNPLDPDSDDDGLGDYAEVITHGTDPNLADSDGDGYNDPQEVAAGTSPILDTEVPHIYFQTFDSFGDGARVFLDGSSVEGTGATSVQGGDFRFLQDGVNSQSSIFRLPPLAGSDEAWCVSFDFVTGSQGIPADGYAMSYGPIVGQPTGQANELGFKVDNTLAFSTVTYNNSGDRGVKIFEDLPAADPVALVDVFGTVIPNDALNLNGRFTAVFDGSGNLVSWSTTGTSNNANFADIATSIAASETNTWAISGRTGGANQELIIKSIAITAGSANIDSDGDGLLDAWELTKGLDPGSAADGAAVNSDGDLYTNGEEFDLGLDPLDASDGGGVHEFTPWIDGFYPGVTDPDVVGPAGNPESDPLSNLLEFGFGTDPTQVDGGSLIWDGAELVRGAPTLYDAFPGVGVDFKGRYMRRIDGSAGYTLEFSSDLSDWEVMAPAESVLVTDGDYQLVEFSYPLFLTNGRKAQFFRVTVTLQ